MHRFSKYIASILLLMSLIFVSCEAIEKLSNGEPVITRVYALRYTLNANDTTTVGVEAEDPDEDAMYFQWHADAGSFLSSQGKTAVWRAPDIAGKYNLDVTAHDENGGEANEKLSITVLGLENPVVEVQYPMDNEYFPGRGEIIITVNASHASGISKVEFYANKQLLGTDDRQPYEQTWNLDGLSGEMTIKAVAYRKDSDTIRGEHSITVFIEGVSPVPI